MMLLVGVVTGIRKPDIHIFRSSLGFLLRIIRGGESLFHGKAKIGGVLPPGGPLILLLSAMIQGKRVASHLVNSL